MPLSPAVIHEQLIDDDASFVVDAGLRSIVNHWQEQRGAANTWPIWSTDFAMEFPSLVCRSMLYEIQDGVVDIKLMGEECRDYINVTVTHGRLDDLIPANNASDIRNRILKCSEAGLPSYCVKTMAWNDGRDYLHYEAVFLPFLCAKGTGACSIFYCPMAFYVGGIAKYSDN